MEPAQIWFRLVMDMKVFPSPTKFAPPLVRRLAGLLSAVLNLLRCHLGIIRVIYGG